MQSINAPGHKYGLVYPAVGWVIWRNKEALPEDLVFDVNYLGGHMPMFALNFSRPGSQVIAQHLMLMSLGRDGDRRENASRLVGLSRVADFCSLGGGIPSDAHSG